VRNNEVWPFLFLVGALLFNWPFLEIFGGGLQFYLFAAWGLFILLIGILLSVLNKKE
jgi:hypothetical protein